jgi:hypothetical protein
MLKFYRGDTVVIDITVTLAGAAYPLTSCTLFATLKTRAADLDSAALKRCETGDGITHSGTVVGKAELKFESSTIASLPVGRPLPLDVQLRTPAGETYTVYAGTILFIQDITLRSSTS